MIALPPLTKGCGSQVTNLGCNSSAYAANNNRQIAGYAENGVMSQNCAAPQIFLWQGVLWTLDASGAPFLERTLPPLPGDLISAAGDLNDAGIAVGESGVCASPNGYLGPARAVLWDNNGVPHLLGAGTLGGSLGAGIAINEEGQVVGVSLLAGDAVFHAFLWEGGPMKDLGSLLPDDNFVLPQSISNHGEVVGESCGPSEPTATTCAGFYWRNGVMIDLNAHLTNPSSLQIVDGDDITDSGEIAVEAFAPNLNGGTYRTGVLVPSQDQQSTSQNLPQQSAAAVQRFVLPSDFAQRFSPRILRGWRIAR
jgi:probable HAF family extracellular repeat protein